MSSKYFVPTKEEEEEAQTRLLFFPILANHAILATQPTYIQNGNISEKFLITIVATSSSSFSLGIEL